MKTIIFLISILLISCSNILGQISTEIYSSKGGVFKKYPTLTIVNRSNIPQIEMPYVDNEELTIKTKVNTVKNQPFRFGKSNEVSLSIKNGIWIKTDSKSIWSLIIHSKNAFSLNIILSELYLTEKSTLFLFDEDGTMVFGPVTSSFNFDKGNFISEIIKGESLVLRIISPNEDVPKIKLSIKNVVHGFRNTFPAQTKTSGGCNNNIECFTDWKIESNAVSRVLLTGGVDLCSGSLINNTSIVLHAYFLTAFHCIDIAGGDPNSEYFEDGTLQQFEKDDVNDMVFRFDYRYTTCEGTTVASYQTFYGATFRAAWLNTDFALVELNSSSIRNTPGITLLGWDKTGNTPTSGVGIHHPSGDVMKISFDVDNLSETSWLSNSGTNFWRTDWDDGITEPGSSGSPLFNQNKKVIGQLKGGFSSCESEDKRDWYGCFYRSWTGGGTNSTRLSNWLDPGSSGGNTLNSLVTLTGADVICSSGEEFTLNDIPTSATISWDCSDQITRVSDQGSNPCEFASNYSGYGWIGGTISYDGSTYSIVKKYVWSGVPLAPDFIYAMDYPPCVGESQYFFDDPGNYMIIGYHWYIQSDYFSYIYNYQLMAYVDSPYSQYITLSVNAENQCGFSDMYYSDPILIEYCGFKMVLSPNPATDQLKIELSDNSIENVQLEIFNSQGVKVISTSMSGNEKTIDISKLQKGVYYISVFGNNKGKGKINTERFIKD